MKVGSRQANQESLVRVFCETLGLSSREEAVAAEYRVTRGWDSVAHMSLVAAVEAEFDVMLDTDQVIALSSFAKARAILADLGVEN